LGSSEIFPSGTSSFGTFYNPPAWEGRAGFEEKASRRLGAMLTFSDVNLTPGS
jgi:hypothetical protein